MPHIPKTVSNNDLSMDIKAYLQRESQGKVRDRYRVDGGLLFVCTDRASIFDVVLPEFVPFKGQVLNATSTFFANGVLRDLPNDLLACGTAIDAFLPKQLRGYKELQKRAVVAREVKIAMIEGITRGYLTGSGFRDYKKTGEVCGIKLPPGLADGTKLDNAQFTPSTKAETGHDKNITEEQAAELVGEDLKNRIKDFALTVYNRTAKYAESRGIIVADNKSEFGLTEDGELLLADERPTPDASRFWPTETYLRAMAEGKTPQGYDKEYLRTYGLSAKTRDGRTINIRDEIDPENPEHLALIETLAIPARVLLGTSSLYLTGFEKLTGKELEQYQEEDLGIKSA